VVPAITGNVGIGNVFTSNTGSWSGASPITYTYQWNKNGANIANATASSYTTITSDSNSTLTCTVTATNSVGNASAISNGIALTLPGYINRDLADTGATISSTVLTVKATPGTLDLVESRATSLGNVASPVVAGVDQNASVNSTVLAIKATPDILDLVESRTTSLGNTASPVVAGMDQNASVNSAILPSITYAYTDSVPVVVSNTAAVSNTQTWYVG
jgi:hypothetical protein